MDQTKISALELETNFNEIPDISRAIVEDCIKQYHQKRDKQILDVLAGMGHVFSTEEERNKFASTRLTIVTHAARPFEKVLLLDGRTVVCSWNDEPNFEWDDNKFILTVGV